jgi:hypothetical protein
MNRAKTVCLTDASRKTRLIAREIAFKARKSVQARKSSRQARILQSEQTAARAVERALVMKLCLYGRVGGVDVVEMRGCGRPPARVKEGVARRGKAWRDLSSLSSSSAACSERGKGIDDAPAAGV